MDGSIEILRMRRAILRAYVMVIERKDELFSVCAAATGDVSATRLALEKTFGIGPVEADAVLDLQVRRFTPAQTERIRQELADVERQTELAERASRS